MILTITVNVSQRKTNCFTEKVITDNRRKSFAKLPKTNQGKSSNSRPLTIYKMILTITVSVSQRKANCFAEKAITDNRRKTFARPAKTIAAKVLISSPRPYIK